ncbi:PH domain-containing protein [Nonomuraea sp. SBT364]|uniref:PH domain-containing protein n=1 Tax=Nonomuraea sp. SBT364 TaxID=1580530 RepID=UPI00066AF969|nr:PH domain-containing protein [Nonomuraea sp. SBT364]
MKQVFRSRTAFVLGWVWVAFVAFNVWDLTARYNGKASMVALAVLGVLTALVYVVAIRPATVFTEEGLVGRNPLRTTVVPWASVREVTVSHSINVDHGEDRVLRLWTPMSSARERARAQRRGQAVKQRGKFKTEPTLTKGEQAAAQALSGKTHADWVGEQIGERADKARIRNEEPGPVRATWAYDSLAIGVVALVLVVAAILVP